MPHQSMSVTCAQNQKQESILLNQIFGRCFPKLIYLEKIFGFFWPLVLLSRGGADLENRSAQDPNSMATPFQIDLSTSHFTPSKVLLQRLASKCSWTESKLAQVIDLFRSPHFHSDDVGLDLTRKVI